MYMSPPTRKKINHGNHCELRNYTHIRNVNFLNLDEVQDVGHGLEGVSSPAQAYCWPWKEASACITRYNMRSVYLNL